MPVYVDNSTEYPTSRMDGHTRRWGSLWSHMWCDPGEEARLHEIAQLIGLRRSYFQDNPRHPHYDVIPSKRALAINAGAMPMEFREWLKQRGTIDADRY